MHGESKITRLAPEYLPAVYPMIEAGDVYMRAYHVYLGIIGIHSESPLMRAGLMDASNAMAPPP